MNGPLAPLFPSSLTEAGEDLLQKAALVGNVSGPKRVALFSPVLDLFVCFTIGYHAVSQARHKLLQVILLGLSGAGIAGTQHGAWLM